MYTVIKKYLELLLPSIIPDTYQSLGKCDVLLCSHDVDLGETLNGLPYSKLIDSVCEDLTDKGWICKQFAHPFSVLTGKKAWGNPASANRKILELSIRQKIQKTFPLFSHLTPGKIKKLPITSLDSFYCDLFDITQPKCIITIGSPASMCSVARLKGIPMIELLHGIGYATDPWGWDKEPPCNLPTGVLSLDDVSTKTFSNLKNKGVEVRQIPHPFFRRFLNVEARKKLPQEWQKKPSWLPVDRPVILVALSWGYDGDHSSYTQFAGILKNGLIPDEVIDAVEQTQDSVFWLFRRHPVQLKMSKYNHHRQFLDKLVKKYPNCEWYESSVLPLPLLLSYCSGHITMSSMTSYDAAFMGVKSLLLCPTLQLNGAGSCYFQDLIASGFAELGNFDTGNIVQWVTGVSRSDQAFTTSVNSDADWDSAIEWMLGKVHKD